MPTSICYADIESTAIPASGVLGVEQIHCIAVKSGSDSTLCFTSRFLPLSNYGGTLRNALDLINQHEFVVGHNWIGFDGIVIEHLLGHLTAKPIDTMLLAKLIYTKDELCEIDYHIPDFPSKSYGSFSLDSFGRRMYLHKGSHSDWSRLSVAMCDYCNQDVEVTYALFQSLLTSSRFPSQSIIDLENEVAHIIAQQVHYGFHYDIESARKLMSSLMYEQLSIELRLQKLFRPMFLPDSKPVVPSTSRKVKIYLPDENYLGF
jgi:hypothetical protein